MGAAMRKILLVIAALFVSVPVASSQTTAEIIILGGRNQTDFLGCLSCNEFNSDSVWNDMSRHGFGNSFSTWNPFGPNKNPYSPTSACNEMATNPPIIVDRRGTYYGEFTINDARPDSVCRNPDGRRICIALRAMCAAD